jgi:hypothetical protein
VLFNWFKTRQPQAGAESYAFTSSINNPIFQLFSGPGTPYFGTLYAEQPPQVYYPNPLTTTAGLGGLIYTTMYGQPLYVPTNRNYQL